MYSNFYRLARSFFMSYYVVNIYNRNCLYSQAWSDDFSFPPSRRSPTLLLYLNLVDDGFYSASSSSLGSTSSNTQPNGHYQLCRTVSNTVGATTFSRSSQDFESEIANSECSNCVLKRYQPSDKAGRGGKLDNVLRTTLSDVESDRKGTSNGSDNYFVAVDCDSAGVSNGGETSKLSK